MKHGYKIGQIVSVRREDGFIFAGRITNFGSSNVDGHIDKYVWVKKGMWGYDQISPASSDQIVETEMWENKTVEMLNNGEKLISYLNNCEEQAEVEEFGLNFG